MEAEKLFKLIDAGFTRDDIMQIISKSTVAGPDPEPQPAEPEPQPAEPEPQPAEPDISAKFDSIIAKVDKMVEDIHALNLAAARQPEPQKVKPEDILAEIIYPKQKA